MGFCFNTTSRCASRSMSCARYVHLLLAHSDTRSPYCSQAAKTANSQRAVHASCHSLSSVRGSAVLLPLAERVLLGFDLQHIGPVPCTSLRVRRASHCPSGSRMYASRSVPVPLVRWSPCRVRCARACLLCAIGQLVVCDRTRSEESLNEVHTSGKSIELSVISGM